MNGQEDREKEILVTRSSLPSHEEYIEMIKPIWNSAWLTNMGDFHKQLEKEFKEYMGIRNMVLFVNGHMVLEMAIQALGLTGEVIITLFSFAPTTYAIARNNLTPVFCDVRPGDYIMDPEKIEVLIMEKASAIIPVHVYGNLCDVERTEAIARRHGLQVIYDAAHIFGERHKGKSVAEFGDASIFSFHATKAFNFIEGGAATFRGDWMEHRLNCFKNFEIVDQEHMVWIGGNVKMNEFQAAMGLRDLHHLDQEIDRRRLVVERYLSDLAGVPSVRLPFFREGLTPNYAYFLVLFGDFKADWDQVYDRLAGHRIYPRKYSYPLINGFQYYKGRFSSKDAPMAAHVADCVLTLPCYIDLELEDVDRIYGIIRGMQETNMDKVLLAISTLNEEKNIERVVEDLVRGFSQPDYMVVNDGPRDCTAKICRRKGYNFLDLPANLGLAGCFQVNMKYAYRKGYRYATQFDGDGQHRPEYIEAMKQKVEERYDIAIGSRFMTEKKGWSVRMTGSRVIGNAIRLITGTRVADPTLGMCTFNRKMIGELALNLNHGPEPDTISLLIKQGARAMELQVIIDERTGGESYLKPLTTVHYMARILISILMTQNFRKRQGRLKVVFRLSSGVWRIYEESDETLVI